MKEEWVEFYLEEGIFGDGERKGDEGRMFVG